MPKCRGIVFKSEVPEFGLLAAARGQHFRVGNLRQAGVVGGEKIDCGLTA
jgi:hypothetical protein